MTSPKRRDSILSRVDERGMIMMPIPQSWRKKLGIGPDDGVWMELEEDGVHLRMGTKREELRLCGFVTTAENPDDWLRDFREWLAWRDETFGGGVQTYREEGDEG